MIDRQKDKLVIECDDLCSDTFEPGTGDYSKAWAAAKAEGWTAKRLGPSGPDAAWTHVCPACQEAA